MGGYEVHTLAHYALAPLQLLFRFQEHLLFLPLSLPLVRPHRVLPVHGKHIDMRPRPQETKAL